MPIETDVRPTVDRDDVAIALVEEVVTGDTQRQQDAAAAVVKHWEAADWPAELVSQSLFTSTDGRTLLTYGQWSSVQALHEHLKQPQNTMRPDWELLGVEPGTPKAYPLYRRVQPTVLPDPIPPVECYPAAFFAMDGRKAAQEWVDGLLSAEEKDYDKDRSYSGALAANFHASEEGIFLISEWASEAEALTHIKAEIEPLLEYMGQAEAGAGTLNTFYATVTEGR